MCVYLSLLNPSTILVMQVLAALGTEYFESLLPDIISNCSHPRPAVREGYLTLFKVRFGC